MSSLVSHSTGTDQAWLEPTWIIDLPEAGRADLDVPSTAVSDLKGLTPLSDTTTQSRHSVPPVRIVDEEHPESQPDPYLQLRMRLTAASGLILTTLSLLFLHQFIRFGTFLSGLEAATLVVMIGSGILLTGYRRLDANHLRLMELFIFGVAGVQFTSTHLEWLARAAEQRNAVDFIWAASAGSFGFAVLILSYGMLMPNGWQRTALMLIPPTLAPIASMVFIRSWSMFAFDAFSPPRLVELTIAMLGVYATAVFGNKTISSLRQEYRRAMRFGQYRLKKRIGRGGMGEVYLAEHRLLKRPCAIKLIRPNQVNDPQSLIRFEREVRATARLSHWNTVEIYDYGRTEDSTFYYVMEYLPGLNLSELVQRFGAMSPDRVVHFLLQTCDALSEAHASGLIHRDLKPANIFSAHRGGMYDVTKLLDFGLVMDDARPELLMSDDMQRTTKFAGSPLYMAPEQASIDLPPDPRSDLYSLAATGYCLLTGRPPFEGKSPLRLMMAHARDPVIPPSRWEPGIPRDLEQIILRCLEKHPSRRFSNIRDLRNALSCCSVAGEWTQEKAAQWWKLRESALLEAEQPDTPLPNIHVEVSYGSAREL